MLAGVLLVYDVLHTPNLIVLIEPPAIRMSRQCCPILLPATFDGG